ncbi:3-deoxy-manno-octulosonate cytidylyltransferase [Alginatibacterium sediminis]|uniref:3-deoxy-manno-octulosonate cytidylyltransferase n=1 Tax=Alginatibacterium sediminis TaxID=2164068 RepID=A0A420EAS7_9ALTE|nr:3-deoxy-manno-octulosonate cytidylyltransferase [Alginatibacterium sediminis]RKF17799.1 3-deoxy-manno-octulosonate cytidylyltransferase [Alginatibacterium sediminis]
MKFTVIIPARYQSTRLPAKALLDIAGKPMLQHVYEQACLSKATRVLIATDDGRIQSAAENFGAQVIMTSSEHQSGTERLAEVVEKLGFAEQEIIVNIQGDEPLIPPVIIDQVAKLLVDDSNAPMATLSTDLTDISEINDSNVVKVVSDHYHNALYFSRAAIPFMRDSEPKVESYQRHIGIYAYRAGFVSKYPKLTQSSLEQLEKLEQLRALSNGYVIKIARAVQSPAHGVDTQADLDKVRSWFKTHR